MKNAVITIDKVEQPFERLNHHDQVLEKSILAVDDELAKLSIDYGGLKKMHFTPSYLRVDAKRMATFEKMSQVVHESVEKIISALANGDESVVAHFASHQHFVKYLKKSTRHWQGFGRYDFVESADGKPWIIELNTCCPGGNQYVANFNRFVERFHRLSSVDQRVNDTQEFARSVLAVEAESGVEAGVVAVLFDENELMIELDLIKQSFMGLGRQAVVADARSLIFDGTSLMLDGQRISSTVNKFRVAGNGDHFWRPGHEERYQDYLAAVDAGAVVSVNNFGGMVFGEDKGILSILSNPKWCEDLGIDPAVTQYIPWTRRTTEIEDLSVLNKNELVLKPANEGRGQGVVIGRYVTQKQWDLAIRDSQYDDLVVQRFVEPTMALVEHCKNGALQQEMMTQTLAIYMLNGESHGLLSRVSTESVTNVGKNGFIQPVVVTK